ncbi:MAG: UDP-2,3-diacylglucosamine diphosphatase [Prosthecochloris sp.]|uniref:Metallophosphoesterase n=1 Tax=Prosthecochloris aestuarii (strain DSM 271 / SK 413) TaxID=290512 RepID=B4S562_PROA2|nr:MULTISPECIES: UDP-2,3-diacylglucosamine diphosphatase [Prosthecochloris]ACF47008.1 metallophosphoesterase [Prosthecochloris aestuarii DSM 271]MCW8798660.1 UDP-2,3-diacylglucosamine diphosphatase [Prosthecochloris sp.]RDD29462.1 UDP-2,3-diacylglucosamine diphosphatase [Prosthecochloris sp. ZM]
MSKSFFISDIHLGLQDEGAEKEKIRHLEKLFTMVASDGAALYMVGDILDYWMEFRHVIPRYFSSFLCLLQELSRHDVRLYWFSGNHDFTLGRFFTDEYGVRCLYGMHEMLIDERRFVIGHGDGLDRSDIGYRLFVAMIRNRFNQRLLSSLQPDLAIAIMRRFSRMSRDRNPGENGYESDFLQQYADALVRQKDFDYFVCGHSHALKKKLLANARSHYINLGTWIHGSYPYAIFDNGVFSLQELSI